MKKVYGFQVGSFVSCEKVEFLCKFIGLFIVLCPASFGTHTLSLGSALQWSKCVCKVLNALSRHFLTKNWIVLRQVNKNASFPI